MPEKCTDSCPLVPRVEALEEGGRLTAEEVAKLQHQTLRRQNRA